MVNRRAILIGTREGAQWHPLGGIDGELRGILTELCDLDVTTDYQGLLALEDGVYDLLIAYADTWDLALDDAQMAAVITFVAKGGGLLVLHNGISFQKRNEFRDLLGARFTGHPPACSLPMRATEAGCGHPILEGLPTEWAMDEEPYRFTPLDGHTFEVLYEYCHEGSWYPAAWSRSFCGGRVVYLMPGHSRASFLNEDYRRLIRSASVWALGR